MVGDVAWWTLNGARRNLPELEEAFAPLAAGVGAVRIVAPGEIATSLAAPGTAGTLLVP